LARGVSPSQDDAQSRFPEQRIGSIWSCALMSDDHGVRIFISSVVVRSRSVTRSPFACRGGLLAVEPNLSDE